MYLMPLNCKLAILVKIVNFKKRKRVALFLPQDKSLFIPEPGLYLTLVGPEELGLGKPPTQAPFTFNAEMQSQPEIGGR